MGLPPTMRFTAVKTEADQELMLSTNTLAWIGMVTGLVAGLVFGFKSPIVITLVLVGSVVGAIVGYFMNPDE